MDNGEWFRAKLAGIFGDGGQSCLARFLAIMGDTRGHETALRTIQNYAAGRRRISGEMVALLNMLSSPPEKIKRAIRQACAER